MKLVYKSFEKDGSGSVTLVPEEAEDMWHAYNLIAENDKLRSTTIRRVTTQSATGSTSSNKVRTTLTIKVENIDFDTQASMLRVKGRNIEENQYVKMGQYHTIDLELNRKFSVTKAYWDCIAIERVDTACDPTQHADLAAIVMQEGIAHVCLVTSCMTIVRAKIDVTIPRKRKGSCSQHDKGLLKFYDTVIQAILRHVNFDEVLADPSIANKLSDTKATGEVKALDAFFKMLQDEPAKAFYGFNQVSGANEAMAIETLLVTDELFRASDVATRRKYVNLVESVKENGGDVKIFSSLHVSGEQLGMLTGVAAILRFPMPDLELEELEDDSSDSDG
eukprot:gene15211-6414_t